MKIAVIMCYKHNDYVRARTLRTAFTVCPGVETLVVRNRHRGLLRYPEVMLRLIKTRLFDRPDVYVVTFRGYEVLLWLRLILIRKPIVFDELINFTEWMVEHNRLADGSVPYRLFRRWNAWVVRRCRFILADTEAHAKHSAKLNMLSIDRYRTIPVCADETVFRPAASVTKAQAPFTVVYFGSMLPLHGLSHILEAAQRLKEQPNIRFRLIGGKQKVAQLCRQAAQAGARVSHEAWVPFEELPKVIGEAGLTLGGPFGDTIQSQFVITGKAYQALACAAPVLIGKNQVSDAFIDKTNCLLVAQADSSALAEAISWAAGHPKELAQIGKAGHELYEKHFSQRVVNHLIEEMVAEL